MTIATLLASSIVIPLLGSLALVVFPIAYERTAARLALSATWLSALGSLLAIARWLILGAPAFHSEVLTLNPHGIYPLRLGLVLDPAAAAFLLLVQAMSGIVVRFSRAYLHREPGFRRFFATILLFQAGMCLLTLAENLDLLFVGWELVGLASFLLIAFYHQRHTAVRNALKVFSIYRVADVGMLLGAYLEHTSGRTGVGLLLLLAAAGKSAQFPFSFWIARAMEGPTPSSALFYGALSIHAGAYLLLHTYSLWGGVTLVHVCIGAVGLITAVLCGVFSRVQHTIKGRVGYASASQVGLIFVEIALGLRTLALVHLVVNALLRCYQLLVSPSAVAYLLRQQSATGGARATETRSRVTRWLPHRLRATLYVFALSEGYLEDAIRKLFWTPLGSAGRWFARPRGRASSGIRRLGGAASLALISGAILARAFGIRGQVEAYPVGMSICVIAALCSVRALGAWSTPLASLAWIAGSSLIAAVAVFASSTGGSGAAVTYYISGIGLFFALAAAGMASALSGRRRIPRFAGLSESRRIATGLAFAGVLGIIGFPLLPTFFGEGAVLHEAFQVHRILAGTVSALFAFNGYLAMREFSHAFLGRSAPRLPVLPGAPGLAFAPSPPGGPPEPGGVI